MASQKSNHSKSLWNYFQTHCLVSPWKAFVPSMTTTWKQNDHLTLEEQSEYLRSRLIHRCATVLICAPTLPAPSGYWGTQSLSTAQPFQRLGAIKQSDIWDNYNTAQRSSCRSLCCEKGHQSRKSLDHAKPQIYTLISSKYSLTTEHNVEIFSFSAIKGNKQAQ